MNNVNSLISSRDFLDTVIENISFTKNNWIILPNKRACIALNQKLNASIGGSITKKIKVGVFNDFLEKISGYKIVDDLELVHLLYDIKLNNQDFRGKDNNIENNFINTQQPFEYFYPLGINLLKDFDLVDKCLLKVGIVFSNVNQYKNLEYDFLTDKQKLLIKEFWNKFEDKETSTANKNLFIKNCNLIPAFYEKFGVQLSRTKKAYAGFVLKEICSEIKNTNSFNKIEMVRGHNLIFAGFSKLYKAEIKLLNFLKENCDTKILWDTAPGIEKIHNATLDGFIINPKKSIEGITQIAPNLPAIYETSSATEEVAFIVDKILEICKDSSKKYDFDKLNNSAIIIPNEYIKRKVINSCKEKGIPYNVFRDTNIRYSKPFIILEEAIRRQILDIQDNCMQEPIMLTLKKIINELKTNTYENPKDASFIDIVENSLNKLDKIFCKKSPYASKEFLYLLKRTVIDDSLKISKNMLKMERFKGIDILEIHDTRALDFDNVFIVSANEADLPPKRNNPSFIPYTLKRAYNIPIDREFENKYYSYLFYNLLYKAKSMIITYRTQDSINGLLEPSRYVLQLLYDGTIPCKINKIPAATVTLNINKTITINKNKHVIEEIEHILKKGLSASAVSTYLDCGLRFYLQYIKRIQPAEEPPSEEQILGNIVHQVLEKIYKQSIQNGISSIPAYKIQSIVNNVVEESLASNNLYKSIYVNIANKIANRILEIDRKNTAYKVWDVEVGKHAPFDTLIEIGDNKRIPIYGIVDRIDMPEINDRPNVPIRLIDYKTGYYDPQIRDIKSLFDKEIMRNKTAFQLLFYALIFHKKYRYKKAICPSVYGIREIFSPKFDSRLRIKQDATYALIEDISPYLPEFEEYLKYTLEEIIDSGIPFSQTTVSKKCLQCPYKIMCEK